MASHTHPVPHCYLKEGKLLSADEHKGFVETYNWLVDFCWNLKAGKGLKIEFEPDSAHPKISIDEEEDEGGGGDEAKITVTGTDGTSYTGNAITFKSAQYCNVDASVGSDGTVTLGVYYV